MTRQCHECQRLNPSDAAYCFYDGTPLRNGSGSSGAGTIDFATWAFPRPFVFPSGEACHNFVQLASACHQHPQEALDAVRHGFLESFFGSLGRADLAMAARAVDKAPDRERGLDEFLEKLPGCPLKLADLEIEPLEKNFGFLKVGEDRQFELKLTNKGDRLVYGKVSVEGCPWLVLGDSAAPEKIFQFSDKATIAVHVRGKSLRAFGRPQKAEIAVESNGGNFLVPVQVAVAVKPFTQGALAGVTSPRQLAEKAKAHPREAAALLESGAVAQWYEANGWSYPVQGPTASGIAAVQQFFELLGLVKAPKVELSESAVTLKGKPGDRLEHTLTLMSQEKRAAWAHAVSDQPWLAVGKSVSTGQMASIPLTIQMVPNEPRRTLTAHVKVTGNGNQRFDVAVTLQVADGPLVPGAPEAKPALPVATFSTAAGDLPAPMLLEIPADKPVAIMPPPMAVPAPVAAAGTAFPVPIPVPAAALAPTPPPEPLTKAARRKQLLIRLLPVGIVLLGLLTAVARDWFFREQNVEEPLPEVDYANPVLALRFHDAVLPGDFVPAPSMTFGLGRADPKDRNKIETKLIYDEYGRTCNVCVRIDKGADYFFGIEQGAWLPPINQPLGKDRDGHPLIGAKCIWKRVAAPLITITQIVEIVPGGLSPDGKKQLLDTCLVRYDITNEDALPHKVGLRFLLDTLIGGNDAPPFTVAGAKELCDTKKEFNKASEVPDYISALERQDLKNPGTKAQLTLKYSGLEPPSRVTLGAWPVGKLRAVQGGEKADGPNTRWEVPVLPMALAKSSQNPEQGDSAVTLYWEDKEVAPKQTRTVGFAYGLGSVSGAKGSGELGLTAGGELVAEKDFTLTAYVKNPTPGTTIALKLPRGLRLIAGDEKATVPALPPGASSPYSTVMWRIHAIKSGVHRVKVKLSTGAELEHKIAIKKAGELFK